MADAGQDLRPKARTLSLMAALSLAAREMKAAEGYVLELVSWCAFGECSKCKTSDQS